MPIRNIAQLKQFPISINDILFIQEFTTKLKIVLEKGIFGSPGTLLGDQGLHSL
jgi:hypothetical protein